jgi:VWFA-related protein
MPKLRLTAVLALFAAIPVLYAADGRVQSPPSGQGQEQQQQQDPQQPIFRTGINFVRVDVIVTDRQGNPITDLQPGDFQVTEDGKPQEIELFRLVNVAEEAMPGEVPRQIRTDYDEESEAARDDVRLFVIMLDDYHVRRGASMAVREPLSNFVSRHLAPTDMVALMYPLTPVSDVRFTRNHDSVVEAIQRFEGRKYNYQPRNEFEERYSLYPVEVVERIRNQVTLSALEGLVTRLGGVREGRKAVILVSEGFSNYVPPQLRDPIAQMPGLGNPNRRDPTAGEGSLAEERAALFSSTDLLRDMREVYNAANRNNTSIYTLDPRGLAPFEYDIDQGIGQNMDRAALQATTDTLRILADQTDGRAIVSRNDLEAGLSQIVRDSSSYYLVGYNSTQAPSDGKFHEIKVRVNRPGAQVRARKGYWALTAEETARALAPKPAGPPPEIERALSSLAEPARGRYVHTWVGTSRGENGRTRVTFVWEAIPAVPGLKRDAPDRVVLHASGGGGQVFFRGPVPADAGLAAGGASGSQPAASLRLPSRASFDVEPGRIDLRISIEGSGADVLDIEDRQLAVPDLTAPQAALSTPVVVRARNPLEYRTASQNPDAVPAAAREFRRTDRLLVRFDVYAPGGLTPSPSARLLNRGGGQMAELTAQPMTGTEGRFQIDLPLASLAAGDYLIEVKVEDASEGEAIEIIAFRVTS